MTKTISSRYGNRRFCLSTPNQYGLRPRTVFSPGHVLLHAPGAARHDLVGRGADVVGRREASTLEGRLQRLLRHDRHRPRSVATSIAIGAGVLITTVWGSGADDLERLAVDLEQILTAGCSVSSYAT